MNPVHMLPEEVVSSLRASKYIGRHKKSIWLLKIKLVGWISVHFAKIIEDLWNAENSFLKKFILCYSLCQPLDSAAWYIAETVPNFK
jgi:hypothetical protein